MNKKAFEMTITTVVVLVIALILLSVGIYIIYTKILKPAETTGSFTACETRGGNPVALCTECKSGELCMPLPSEDGTKSKCCISEIK